MKKLNKFIKVFISLSTITFFSFNIPLNVNAKILIAGGTHNGKYITPHCGEILNYPAGSNLTLYIVGQDDSSLPCFMSVSAPAELLAVSTFNPPLPQSGSGFIMVEFTCTSLPVFAGDMIFNFFGGYCGSETCVIHFDFPLPVELASFTSQIYESDVTLNWTTSSEINNSGFDIERSIVNGQWSMLNFVAGNGNSITPQTYSYSDRNLPSGKYNYRLKQIDFNGNFEYFNLSNEVNVGVPEKFSLSQNYPNPFNPTTNISYELPFDSKISIKLFDMSGKEVATLVDDAKTAGYYTINFNGSEISSGVYFYRITAEGNGKNFIATKKMMLVK